MPWLRRTYTLPASLEDAASALLWEGGTLGCEVRPHEGDRVRIEAYFPPGTPDPLSEMPAVEAIGAAEEVPDQDWLAPWRRQARPFDLGARFRVDPREPDEADDPGKPPSPLPSATGDPSCRAGEGGSSERGEPSFRRWLRLPARAAFGVGSHASTRLAVEVLETLPLSGLDVLDVGTGTGVLAFAALHLGARRVVAFDLDPAAAVAARDNACRNRFSPLLFAGTAAALSPDARYHWALVNVVPELILPAMPHLAPRVRRGLVLSGILADKGDAVASEVARLGFAESGRARDGDWVALRMEREPAP